MFQAFRKKWRQRKVQVAYLAIMAVLFAGGYYALPVLSADASAPQAGAAENPVAKAVEGGFQWFAPFTDVKFGTGERVALIVILVIAVAGLCYALMLVGQVRRADQGTPKMQEIAAAVREGANAYLSAQFRKIGPLILVITCPLCHQVHPASEYAVRPCRGLPRGLAV